MPSIDYQAIKDSYPLGLVLQRVWGIVAVRRDRGGSHGRCPVCGSSPRSETLSWTDRLWYCHRCCVGGSVIDLYARVFGLPIYAAAAELGRRMDGRGCWQRYRGQRQPRRPRTREEAL